MADGCCLLEYAYPLFGFGLIWYGISRYKTAQQVMNTPTSKVRSVAVGLVELKGKAVLDKKFISPISGRECAYWDVSFAQNGSVRFSMNQRKMSSFYLDDGTGRVLVKTDMAEMVIHKARTIRGSISGKKGKQFGKRALKYIKSLDERKRTLLGSPDDVIEIHERCITEGDVVYVLGTASPVENARKEAQSHERLMIHRGLLDGIMVISDRYESAVVKKLKNDAYVSGLVGILIVIIWTLFQFFQTLI
ncbi:MAG: hypothetical protein ACXABY_22625 [Candidatus Thorarchaeota archaeon]|jgi:hypothetical protein